MDGGLTRVNQYVVIFASFVTFSCTFSQNYVADWTMSFTWGAIIGLATPIPYFYSVFFITVLVHRCGRDFERYIISLSSKYNGLNFLLL